MRQVNIYEMIAKLNNFCESSRKERKSFTGAELNEALMKIGFSKIIASAIAQRCFPYELIGKGRLYEVPREPIHKDVLKGLYDRQVKYQKKRRSSIKKVESKKVEPKVETFSDNFNKTLKIQEAIKLLLSEGYKISRPLGLDVKALLADHPELESKYMRYANV